MDNQRHALILTKEDLARVFGDIRKAERIKQRIFHLNKLGESLNIRLAFCGVDATLAIYCSNTESVRTLIERLLKGKGRVQRLMGQLLSVKFKEALDPEAKINAFLKIHSRAASLLAAEALPGAPAPWPRPDETRDILDQCWVDPPAAVSTDGHPAQAVRCLDDAADAFLKSSSSFFCLTGPMGAGKTAALERLFKQAAGVRFKEKKISPAVPLFLEARILAARGRGCVEWAALPAGGHGPVEEMERLWREGRLLVFIDALEENPKLTDFENPEALSFWEFAGKNRCVLTAREDFWESTKTRYFNRRFAQNQMTTARLTPWKTAQFKSYFAKLSGYLKTQGKNQEAGRIDHLANISTEELELRLGCADPTPLGAFAYAHFFGVLKEGRFPKNGNELKNHMSLIYRQWQSNKPADSVPITRPRSAFPTDFSPVRPNGSDKKPALK